MTNRIIKLYEDLEKEIEEQGIAFRWDNYDENCYDCKFWKKFDKLKKEVLENI